METQKLDPVAEMLAQYERNSKNSYQKSENAVAFDEKHYFGTFLEPKVNEISKRIRIIPTKDGSSPFVEMIGHKIKVENSLKTFPCLSAEKNEACPFCEARSVLLSTGKESDKELAKQYSQRKMYIVKLIDRDHEEDGPKFWRFNHDYRKQGIYDKIIGILRVVKDITSVDNGRDLSIPIARDQNNRAAVQTIVAYPDSTPLSENKELAEAWINDPMKWQDVYSFKPYDYLEIIVKGGVPVFDKELKKFVDKKGIKEPKQEPMDSELTMGINNINSNTAIASAPDLSEDMDDLPF